MTKALVASESNVTARTNDDKDYTEKNGITSKKPEETGGKFLSKYNTIEIIKV